MANRFDDPMEHPSVRNGVTPTPKATVWLMLGLSVAAIGVAAPFQSFFLFQLLAIAGVIGLMVTAGAAWNRWMGDF